VRISVETVIIQGREGRSVTFRGELAVPVVTTWTEDKPRWVEFRLYRREDGGFVVHREGVSMVYHGMDAAGCVIRDGTPKGFLCLVRELPGDAEPCEDEPDLPWPEDMPPDAQVRKEEPRHTVSHCATPAEVADSLTWDPRTQRRVWTAPVTRLLTEAAKADPAFADLAQSPTVRL
jgi:hypothetical protein